MSAMDGLRILAIRPVWNSNTSYHRAQDLPGLLISCALLFQVGSACRLLADHLVRSRLLLGIF